MIKNALLMIYGILARNLSQNAFKILKLLKLKIKI